MEVRTASYADVARELVHALHQVLSIDNKRAVELLRQNKGNVDAAVSTHFRSFK